MALPPSRYQLKLQSACLLRGSSLSASASRTGFVWVDIGTLWAAIGSGTMAIGLGLHTLVRSELSPIMTAAAFTKVTGKAIAAASPMITVGITTAIDTIVMIPTTIVTGTKGPRHSDHISQNLVR